MVNNCIQSAFTRRFALCESPDAGVGCKKRNADIPEIN